MLGETAWMTVYACNMITYKSPLEFPLRNGGVNPQKRNQNDIGLFFLAFFEGLGEAIL